jgi:hypothetical protein
VPAEITIVPSGEVFARTYDKRDLAFYTGVLRVTGAVDGETARLSIALPGPRWFRIDDVAAFLGPSALYDQGSDVVRHRLNWYSWGILESSERELLLEAPPESSARGRLGNLRLVLDLASASGEGQSDTESSALGYHVTAIGLLTRVP